MNDFELLETALEQPKFLKQIEGFAARIKGATVTPLSTGDLSNIGWVAAREALDDYDPERGEVMGFLCVHARGAIMNAVRNERTQQAYDAAYAADALCHGDDINDLQAVENAIDAARLLEILDGKDPEGARMMELWAEGATLREIADELGITHVWVRERLAGGISVIRAAVYLDILELIT